MFKKYITILLTLIIVFSMGAQSAFCESFDTALVNNIMKSTTINNLKASSCIIIDGENGEVLFEKNATKRLPMASITKIMTAILVMEAIEKEELFFEDIVEISNHAFSMGGSQVYMEPGEEFTVRELMRAMEIHSANDAAVALAEKVAGTEDAFVQLMNLKAKELEMVNTHFLDCTGLTDVGHYSTAEDISIMAKELITKYPQITEFTTVTFAVFRPGPDHVDMYNRNSLIGFYNGANGLKTGFTTEAGYCLAATAKRDDMQYIAVVLGEPDSNTRFAEACELLDYAFLNFERVHYEYKDTFAIEVEVKKGVEETVKAFYTEDIKFLLEKFKEDDIIIEYIMDEDIEAPLAEGSIIGSAEFILDDEILGSIDLVVENKVEKASIFVLFFRIIKGWLGIG